MWTWKIPPTPPSRFVYLVQSESCLPDSLTAVEALGNSTACHCDVLVLSYYQACSYPSPKHIEYISATSPTSWSEGRNLLYRTATNRSEKYLYYIFMDDDITLQIQAAVNPWRVFEDFLTRIEPAVGAVDTTNNHCVSRTYRARKLLGCGLNGYYEYVPAVHYDAGFNAFHHEAVDYILPYSSKFDAISWLFSQWYVVIKSKVIFPRQVVLYNGLLGNNGRHRIYPRKKPLGSELQGIIKQVQEDLPKKYQNSNLLLEWKEYGEEHENRSRTVTCLPPPPPKMPIQPFHYRSNVAS